MAIGEDDKRQIRIAMSMLIKALGCDLDSEEFKNTPDRVARLYSDILDGNYHDLDEEKMTSFREVEYDGMVMITRAPFYGFCAHHFLPFIGTFSMAYMPKEKVLGLSKLVRIFRYYTKVPSTQENITKKAVEALMKITEADGAMCYVAAEHMCMSLRGVKSPGSITTTMSSLGVFNTQPELRQQFLDEVHNT